MKFNVSSVYYGQPLVLITGGQIAQLSKYYGYSNLCLEGMWMQQNIGYFCLEPR
jgi:hypothetical protein